MYIKSLAVLVFMLMMASCSMGTRVRNMVNAPIELETIHGLDSLNISPDVMRFTGLGESGHYTFLKDVRILGRHKDRPMWQAIDGGVLTVTDGAHVRILDFNFSGVDTTDTLIIVENGTLVLENCDIWNPGGSGIHLGDGSILQLRNVRFSKLKDHGIFGEPDVVKLTDCHFDLGGNSAIVSDSTELFEAHRVQVTGTMGRGIELNGCSEVWLDSVTVTDSFEDGLYIENCSFTLLQHVKTAKNGRNGLTLNNSQLSGIIGFSAVGNLVNGLNISNTDTLRMTRTELIGNADQGAKLDRVGQAKIEDMVVGHNAVEGLVLEGCEQVDLRYATFQANLELGLRADSVQSFDMSLVSFLHNGDGLHIRASDTVSISRGILKENKGNAVSIERGEVFTFAHNSLIGNVNGLQVENVQHSTLDSNSFSGHELAMNFRLSGHLFSNSNVWKDNKIGVNLTEVYAVQSANDRWLQNFDQALEAMSVSDFLLQNATIRDNRNGFLLNDVSAKMEACGIDTNSGYGLKGLNSSIVMNTCNLDKNVTAIELGDGSGAKVTQSAFRENLLSILSDANSDLSLSFSLIEGGGSGLVMENYAKADIISNRFNGLDGYALEITGPHIRSVYMRQNVVSESEGVIKSKSRSGNADLVNNTFVGNTQNFEMGAGTIGALDHNILHGGGPFDLQVVENAAAIRWNCFGADTSGSGYSILKDTNLFMDPKLDANYFLGADSPCLNGGQGGQLIGAQGIRPPSRPKLEP